MRSTNRFVEFECCLSRKKFNHHTFRDGVPFTSLGKQDLHCLFTQVAERRTRINNEDNVLVGTPWTPTWAVTTARNTYDPPIVIIRNATEHRIFACVRRIKFFFRSLSEVCNAKLTGEIPVEIAGLDVAKENIHLIWPNIAFNVDNADVLTLSAAACR